MRTTTPVLGPPEIADPVLTDPYVRAAAVLSYFDPERINPTQADVRPRAEALTVLLSNSTIAYDDDTPRWTLLDSVRQRVLRDMGNATSLRSALQANAERPDDRRQRLMEAYLAGQSHVEVQDDEIAVAAQVSRWFQNILPNVPNASELAHRVELQQLLEPFVGSVGNHFRGRKRELETMEDFAGVLPTRSPLRNVKRAVRQFQGGPLVIVGPGGTGKSTLVGKFILDHLDRIESGDLAFVYLDFDRPGLLADRPATLLLEGLRQLAVQFPDYGDRIRERAHDWTQRLLEEETGEDASPLESASMHERKSRPSSGRSENLYGEFGEIFERLRGTATPLLLVLDTFEKVQSRGASLVLGVWDFLRELRRHMPTLRTVIAGRADLDAGDVKLLGPQILRLAELDRDASVGFLVSQGLDQNLALAVATKVGGNPLSLKLAADVCLKERLQPDDLEEFRQPRFMFLKTEESRVQSYLYRRILKRIDNPEVRKIAHPGMVLRRLTPELILQVLAEPCELAVKTLDQARELCDALRKEGTLVLVGEDGALEHRPDLRRAMLTLLWRDQPEKVERIHRGAIEFYRSSSDPAGLAELLYHRLSLKDIPDRKEQWPDGVGARIATAMDELPAAGQAYLAGQFGLRVSPEVLKQAEQEQWEQITAVEARRMLELGHPNDVLRLLRARKATYLPASPLYILEAKALDFMERRDEARACVERGLASAETSTERKAIIDLLVSAVAMGQDNRNQVRLQTAYELSGGLLETSAQLSILLSLVELLREGSAQVDTASVEEQALATFMSLGYAERVHAPALLTRMAILFGMQRKDVLAEVVDAIGFGLLDPERARPLFRAIRDSGRTNRWVVERFGPLFGEVDDARRFEQKWYEVEFEQARLVAKIAAQDLREPECPDRFASAVIDLLKSRPATEERRVLA